MPQRLVISGGADKRERERERERVARSGKASGRRGTREKGERWNGLKEWRDGEASCLTISILDFRREASVEHVQLGSEQLLRATQLIFAIKPVERPR